MFYKEPDNKIKGPVYKIIEYDSAYRGGKEIENAEMVTTNKIVRIYDNNKNIIEEKKYCLNEELYYAETSEFRSNKLVKTKTFHSENPWDNGIVVYNYNSYGRILEKKFFKDDVLSGINKFEYNEKGLLVKVQYYEMENGNETNIHTDINKYDDNGNLIHQYSLSCKDGYGSDEYFEYDNMNRLISRFIHVWGNDGPEGEIYTYDSLNQITEIKYQGSKLQFDNQIGLEYYGKATFKYDDFGQLLEKRSYDSNDNFCANKNYIYQFDEHGNWLKKLVFNNGGLESILKREIEYYKTKKDNKSNSLLRNNLKGNIMSLKETVFSGVDKFGEFEIKSILDNRLIEYNKSGNIFKITSLDNQEKVKEETFFDYNENEKLIVKKTINDTGQIIKKTEYTYNNNGIISEKNTEMAPSNSYRRHGDSKKIKYEIDNNGYVVGEETIFYFELDEYYPPRYEQLYYQYDAFGNRIRVYSKSEDMHRMLVRSMKYDDNGNIIEDNNHYTDGNIAKKVMNYNTHGDLVEEKVYDSDGDIKSSNLIKYYYDDVGNWIKSERYEQHKKLTTVTVRDIEYYG